MLYVSRGLDWNESIRRAGTMSVFTLVNFHESLMEVMLDDQTREVVQSCVFCPGTDTIRWTYAQNSVNISEVMRAN